MRGFSKLPVLLCVCLLSGTARAATPAEDVTRFFETHPNTIDVEKRGDSILFANRQIGLEFKQLAQGFGLARLYGVADIILPGRLLCSIVL